MKFNCFVCGKELTLKDEYKSRCWCDCGNNYKLEIGQTVVFRFENKDTVLSRVADETYHLGIVKESRDVKDIRID